MSEQIEAEVSAIPAYPIAHYLSTELRKHAAAVGYREAMSMWCGQGVQQIRSEIDACTLLAEIRDEIHFNINQFK